jgi:hypothetical protein
MDMMAFSARTDLSIQGGESHLTQPRMSGIRLHSSKLKTVSDRKPDFRGPELPSKRKRK